MLRKVMALLLSGAAVAALSACVPAGTSTTATVEPPEEAPIVRQPVPEDFVNAYAARADAFPIPAVPEDQIPAQLRRQLVDYVTDDPVGTIIIDPSAKTLHLVTAPGKAMRYGIAVGAEGFQWSGESLITGRRHWPTWTPPKEMISRKPELAKWEKGQPGGPTNPLGARALYLTTNGVDHGFRIHGTPEWKSIGRNASSGCFRMINQDVIDLYDRVPNGVKVVVLNADGSRPNGLNLPPPRPVKKAVAKPAPKPEAQPAADPAVSPAAAGAPAPGFPTMTPPALSAPATVTAPALSGPVSAPAISAPAEPQLSTTLPEAPAATPVPVAPMEPAPAIPAATTPAETTPTAPTEAAPVQPVAPAPSATPSAAETGAENCVPSAEKSCP